MAIVTLEFPPPIEPDIVTLHIQEGATAEGPFVELETHPAGEPPDYINHITVTDATSADDWFRVAWENAAGGLTEWSEPVIGSEATYLSKLVDRVMLRVPYINENVIVQEAEGVIEEVLGVDPYSAIATTVKYKTWNAMTLIVMARVQLSEIASSNGTSSGWTSGLVSMKSSSTTTLKIDDIRNLLDEAARLLGFSTARIVQMIPPEICGGLTQVVMADISRLEIDVA